MPSLVLLILFCALPLGTAANEIATGLALAAALFMGDRRQRPMLAPVLLIMATLLLSAVGHGVD